ncbi:hypothetical protein [uncultured Methanobrevibacter sp.]|uniref:hypothetical protein n=1 Tax=uncultured Methanobrevibacter sp. TaxID=253161 RepID=UPI00261CEE2D|nr:hypothetical protein [uncultured Methanobrevibacter sp.]
MKIKLAIIFGILIWIFTYILTEIFTPIFAFSLPDINILVPAIVIVVTGFFAILYIRNINENEVIEGLAVGMIFVIIDIILDYIFFLNPNASTLMFSDYTLHFFSMIILTLLITTFVGYLAQMTIDLK